MMAFCGCCHWRSILQLLGAFYIQMVVSGYMFIFWYDIWPAISEFQTLTWIIILGGLIPGLCFILAPLADIVTSLIGIRFVVAIGASLQLIGFLIVLFASFIGNFSDARLFCDLFGLAILQGVAAALLYEPTTSHCHHIYNQTVPGFATGYLAAAMPTGALVFGILYPQFSRLPSQIGLTEQAWRGSTIFLALFTLPIFGILPIFPQRRAKNGGNRNFVKDYFNKFRKWNYPLLLASSAFFSMGYYFPLFEAIRNPEPVLLIGWAVASVVGRIGLGVIADLRTRLFCSFMLIVVATAVCAATTFAYPYFEWLIILHGLVGGPAVSLRPMILSELYNEKESAALFAGVLPLTFGATALSLFIGTQLSPFELRPIYAIYVFGGICLLFSTGFTAGLGKYYFYRFKQEIALAKQRNVSCDCSVVATATAPDQEQAQEQELQLLSTPAHGHIIVRTKSAQRVYQPSQIIAEDPLETGLYLIEANPE